MAKIPEMIDDAPTVKAIYEALKKKHNGRFSRRLGASIVGKECARAVWYDFRWATKEDFDGRMLRLFQTGSLAEVRFAHELKDIGCEVHLQDDETKNQIEFTAVGGHFVCKIDAAILGVPEAQKAWHVGEFKTHNAKSFGQLKLHGVRKSKPQHYAQVIVGMLLSGMPRGLYLAANKDNDELYAERFRIEECKGDADKLIEFAQTIIESTRAPERISADRDGFACKFCPHVSACHGTTPPSPSVAACVTCRSCCHATPQTGGTLGLWRCERHNKTLSEQDQLKACEDHLFIPDFITFANVVDGGDADGGFVEYQNPDGTTWRNGNAGSSYRSIELAQLPSPLIGNGEVDEVKKQIPGSVVTEVSA